MIEETVVPLKIQWGRLKTTAKKYTVNFPTTYEFVSTVAVVHGGHGTSYWQNYPVTGSITASTFQYVAIDSGQNFSFVSLGY